LSGCCDGCNDGWAFANESRLAGGGQIRFQPECYISFRPYQIGPHWVGTNSSKVIGSQEPENRINTIIKKPTFNERLDPLNKSLLPLSRARLLIGVWRVASHGSKYKLDVVT
jgi:hypothetical protein